MPKSFHTKYRREKAENFLKYLKTNESVLKISVSVNFSVYLSCKVFLNFAEIGHVFTTFIYVWFGEIYFINFL